MEQNFLGKKIFFLYPHSVIKDTLTKQLIKNEYEVYLLKDHKKVPALMKKYNDSVLFINIDDGMDEPEWEIFIRDLIDNSESAGVMIGILSYENNDQLREKYLMDIMIPCGFIVLKIGLAESTKIILKTLEVNEARGRRKYIRIKCAEQDRALFNVKITDNLYSGRIDDISSVGIACVFDKKNIPLKTKQVLKDIQIRLKGSICMVTGVLLGTRETDAEIIYVILFAKNITPASKSKIQDFIYTALQNQIARELNQL